MLISLHVKNLALIAETEVNFGEGLNILSGETGAGKSILIGSINLALGARADKDMIRTGAEYALVELVFQAPMMRSGRKLKPLRFPLKKMELSLSSAKYNPVEMCLKYVGRRLLQNKSKRCLNV